MPVYSGLDRLIADDFAVIAGKRIGVVCNQASIDADCVHILDRLLPGHGALQFDIRAVFGPQHGIWGHTQDNMIEWEGYVDPDTGLTFHSLYGEVREPTDEMLDGLDMLVIDLPDIGSRYYTFLWTMALCMKQCERLGIQVLVLDRPNPIGGTQVEGTMLDPGLASFVGLYPLPTRHGLTLGEAALCLRNSQFPRCEVFVWQCEGWTRERYGDETGLPWAMPSPNMPTVDTAIVYPGMCLIEGTQLSEGRGTTRPFEIVGAPYLDERKFADALNRERLPGVYFRPIQFEPTFHKFEKRICRGVFLHVRDRRAFEPVLTGLAVIREAILQGQTKFHWRPAPYEYVHDREPIDILAGQHWVRPALESYRPLQEFRERMASETNRFHECPEVELLYDGLTLTP